jgi:hypothetical protein
MKKDIIVKLALDRRKLVVEERSLLIERNCLNKKLRDIRDSMHQLDNILVNNT